MQSESTEQVEVIKPTHLDFAAIYFCVFGFGHPHVCIDVVSLVQMNKSEHLSSSEQN